MQRLFCDMRVKQFGKHPIFQTFAKYHVLKKNENVKAYSINHYRDEGKTHFS